MPDAFICDAVRTPIGRYAGSLSSLRPDDLAALTLSELMRRHPQLDWKTLDDVILGCANQAGEDNRNVARMASLLAGLPLEVGGDTVNRLCGSGLDAVGIAARAIKAGEADRIVAGGVESMSRAPFVLPKADRAFGRSPEIFDTTIGWRFINPRMRATFGVDSMPETAENVAADYGISRADQDLFALRSQQKAIAAQDRGDYRAELLPITLEGGKAGPVRVDRDEHPRADTTLESLARLKGVVSPTGSVTAGNASGVNDGAAALLICSERAMIEAGLTPLARIRGMASAGVPPRIMGMGPVPATQKLLARLGISLNEIDLIELNEAFAAQSLAVLRQWGVADDDRRVNPLGGAIALGHPLGMSGARLVTTAAHQLRISGGRLALCTMCVGVGQGIAMVIENAAP